MALTLSCKPAVSREAGPGGDHPMHHLLILDVRTAAGQGVIAAVEGLATRSVGSSWRTTWRVVHVSGWKIVPGSPPGATRKRRPDQPAAALLLRRGCLQQPVAGRWNPGYGLRSPKKV